MVIREVVILYTNDLHGNVEPQEGRGGIAYLAAEMDRVRAENEGKPIFYVDSGDTFQGSVLSDQTHGRPMIEFLNRERPDAVVVGNHEFDTGFGVPVLEKMAPDVEFPWLGANVVDRRDGRRMDFLEGSVEAEHEGVRAAVIGVTTPDRSSTPARNITQVEFTPMGEAIEREAARHPDVDLKIALVHEGAGAIAPFAEATDEQYIIVGGHTHEETPEPVKMGNSWYVQGGSYGANLGVLHVLLDPVTRTVLGCTNELRPIRPGRIAPDPEMADVVAREARAFEERLARVVGHTDQALTANNAGESTLSNLICDAIRSGTGADVAFMNSRNARADISAGEITMRELYQVTPWDIPAVSAEIAVPHVKEALEMGVSAQNFGGEHADILQMSGMSVVYDLARPEGARVVEARLDSGETLVRDGEVVDPERKLTVATHPFLMDGGRDYRGLTHHGPERYGELIRDLVARKLEEGPPATEPQGRIRYLTSPTLESWRSG